MSGPQNLPLEWDGQQLTPRRSPATKSWTKLCQCEYAKVSVPMQIVESVMKGLIGVARQAGRVYIIRDLEEHWENYTKSSYSGAAAASMGAALVVARQEICPKESAKYRLCPNCMYRSPKNMLMCPQCKGKFVSAGVANQTVSVFPSIPKQNSTRW